ncbi:hypothetical protein TWF694_002284 [Orbilia ellipsospora]|uniref:Uncharacterized protein n=1 Tax=Orbilia ellipsospora TaxID=2528407 RepID=A0AAV9X1Q3_9PEZI
MPHRLMRLGICSQDETMQRVSAIIDSPTSYTSSSAYCEAIFKTQLWDRYPELGGVASCNMLAYARDQGKRF